LILPLHHLDLTNLFFCSITLAALHNEKGSDMHFNILPGEHVIVTSQHPNPKFAPDIYAALVVFVGKECLGYHSPFYHDGIAEIKKSGIGWSTAGGTVLALTGPNGEDLLASGFVSE